MDLVPQPGGTLVTLSHLRFARESSRDGHQGGWTRILDGLATACLQATA